jgi:putative transposase
MLYIEPGSPWENFDECLDQEIFYSSKEAQIVIEQWRNQYGTIRPHSSLGDRPPAPQIASWPHCNARMRTDRVE